MEHEIAFAWWKVYLVLISGILYGMIWGYFLGRGAGRNAVIKHFWKRDQ